MNKTTDRLFIIALVLLSLVFASLFFVSLTGKFALPFYSVDECKSRLDSCISECKKTPIDLFKGLCDASCGWAYGKCKETGEWPSKENQEKWKEMSASSSTSEYTRKIYNFKTTIQKRGVGKCDVNLQPIITIDNIDRRIVNLCWPETFQLPEGKHTIEISADGCEAIREEIYVDHDIERDYLLSCWH